MNLVTFLRGVSLLTVMILLLGLPGFSQDWSPQLAARYLDQRQKEWFAFVLQRAGIARSHPGLTKVLRWLASHQDRQFGYWTADSMNKRYPDDSMQVRFLQDAATGFATLALLEGH